MTILMVLVTQVDDALPLVVVAIILGALTARWVINALYGPPGDSNND